MLMPHFYNRVHDDIRIGIGKPGIDQDEPLVAGDQERFDDASRALHAARDYFHTVDRDIFQNADDDFFLTW
jgi:hypothetical protein